MRSVLSSMRVNFHRSGNQDGGDLNLNSLWSNFVENSSHNSAYIHYAYIVLGEEGLHGMGKVLTDDISRDTGASTAAGSSSKSNSNRQQFSFPFSSSHPVPPPAQPSGVSNHSSSYHLQYYYLLQFSQMPCFGVSSSSRQHPHQGM